MPAIARYDCRFPSMTRFVLSAVCTLILGLSVAQTGSAQTTQPAPAQDTRQALVVLMDGSGSMWGGLGAEGKSKLAAAREALAAVLPRLTGSHRLGLATFGPGCRAAGVGVAPGEGSADNIVAPLVKFNPRGKGPLSAGLKAAADAIGEHEAGSIVVFHDGLDNCGEDPCSVAERLHAAKPNLRISTISMDMEAAEVEAIGCVAKVTGGRAYDADDPDAVMTALSEVANLTNTIGPGHSAAAKQSEGPAVPTPKPAEKGPARLVASARLIAGGTVVSMPLSWRVTSADGKNVLHEAVSASVTVPLPAGPVRVEVTSGRMSVQRNVDIAKQGDTVVDVVLDAGIVRFDTGAERLASDAEEPLIFLEKLNTAAADKPIDKPTGADASAPLWIARGKAIEALLPPGDYKAVAEYGLARAVAKASVVAGQALNLALPLEAGRLELSTTPQGLDDVVYRIEVDDPDRPGGRRELTRTANATPSFVLSTGTYYVTAATGGDEVRRLITVRSGEVTRENFKLGLIGLNVDATLNGAPAGREPLTLDIKSLDNGAGGRPAEARLVSLGRPIQLAPGRYRVTLRHGLNDAVAWRDIKLGGEKAQRLHIDLLTAEISLDMSGNDGTPLGAVCEMKSEQGDVIWRTVEIRPSRVVAPGQYALHCQAARAVRNVAVTAAAGQITRVKPFVK